MPRKLNDTQVLELVTKYANGTSISALAKEYSIEWRTVKRYIENNREIVEKIHTTKNESISPLQVKCLKTGAICYFSGINIKTDDDVTSTKGFTNFLKKQKMQAHQELALTITTFDNFIDNLNIA